MPITDAEKYLNSLINANERNINSSSSEDENINKIYTALKSNLETLLGNKNWIEELQLFLNNNPKFKDLDCYEITNKLSNWFLEKGEDSLSAFLKLGTSNLTNEQMNELIKSILFRASVTHLNRWFKPNARGATRCAKEVYSPDFLLKFISLNNEAADALLDIFDLLYDLIGVFRFKQKCPSGITRELFLLFVEKAEEDIIYIANYLRCEKPAIDDVATLIKEINDAKLIYMLAQKLLNDLKGALKKFTFEELGSGPHLIRGTGTYGMVYQAMNGNTATVAKEDGKQLAYKEFRNKDQAAIQSNAEARIMMNLTHPNIIKLYGVTTTPEESHALVIEYASKGSLEHYVLHKKWDPIDSTCKRMLIDIAAALAYLHSKNIIHRDLRLANILLSSELKIKLCDFGLSTQLPQDAVTKDGPPFNCFFRYICIGRCVLEMFL